VIAMLRRPEGATVDEVASATGWQHHTVRGVFSGLPSPRPRKSAAGSIASAWRRTYEPRNPWHLGLARNLASHPRRSGKPPTGKTPSARRRSRGLPRKPAPSRFEERAPVCFQGSRFRNCTTASASSSLDPETDLQRAVLGTTTLRRPEGYTHADRRQSGIAISLSCSPQADEAKNDLS